jgi:hypothetical protein
LNPYDRANHFYRHLCDQPSNQLSSYAPTEFGSPQFTAAMSFGFSVGDVLAALTLAKDLTVALSETKGVAIELQQLKTMHYSIQKTVNDVVRMAEEWDRAHPNPSNKAFISALVEEQKTCKKYLDNFWKSSEKYMLSILNEQPKGSREKMKRELAKMRWYMFHSNDAAALERNLRTPVGAIKLHSDLLRWYVLFSVRKRCSYRFTARYSKISKVPIHRRSQL